MNGKHFGITLATLLALCTSHYRAAAQGTAFTYQGRLLFEGNPVSDNFDMRFALFDHVTGGSQLGSSVTVASPPVPVNAGLFLVTLDFGPDIFTGPSRWLEIAVRPSGSAAAYTVLAPRNELLPIPYAIYAESAGRLNPPVALSASVNSLLPSDPSAASVLLVTNSSSGLLAGSGITVGGQTALVANSPSGNSAMLATPKFGAYGLNTGTNGAAVRGLHSPSGAYGELGKTGVTGAEIFQPFYYGVYGNAGNGVNGIDGYAGYFDGAVKVLGTLRSESVDPTAAAFGYNSSQVPGAAGVEGSSLTGYGVSGYGGDIGVFASNTASGHTAYLATKTLAADLYGDVYVHGTVTQTSDRAAKEGFAPVDPLAILDKVAALPVESWSFKGDIATRHIGPMAQDFHAAFATGPDDMSISVVDAQGVALAAIQGLNEKVESENRALRAALASRDAALEDLRRRLAALRDLVTHPAP